MDLTTPALLFPAISLLLLAYTNRFVVLTGVIRSFASNREAVSGELVRRQIDSMRRRLTLIRNMQILGVGAFVLCTLSMGALFLDQEGLGEVLFGSSLLALLGSLLFSLLELKVSTEAINLEIDRIRAGVDGKPGSNS